jgi:outer membrane beta-barrel protein
MTQLRRALITAITWVFLASSLSLASEGPSSDEPLLNAAPVLTGKWSATHNRFEFSLFPYDVTFRNTYVQVPYAAHASVGYHIFDFLSVEAFGGYAFVREDTQTTTILRSVATVQDFELAGLWRPVWFAGANVLYAPFYGKFSIFSEVEGAFQLYALAGAGADGLERPDQTGALVKAIRFAGNFGGGIRLFFTPDLAVRVEVRENIGYNALVDGPDGNIQGYTWLQLGVSLFL